MKCYREGDDIMESIGGLKAVVLGALLHDIGKFGQRGGTILVIKE